MKINLQLAAIFLFLVLFYNKSLLAENVYVDLELVLESFRVIISYNF